ncbi:MAG: hypothetical protein IKM20_07030 [Erysipelotrichales bacterium]|nr:hypothetical protein [Erysipelotrichales bacterium]
MLEVFKYIDKVKGLKYVLDVAKSRKISQSKLCEGIYDSSNFYKICKNPTEKNINSEKLRLLFAKLNIGKDEIMINCTVFNKRTLELLSLINSEGRAYDFSNYPKYLTELEEINVNPVTELTQIILWKKGIYEYSKHHYDAAISYFDEAMNLTKPDYKLETNKNNRLTEVEMNILNDSLIAKFWVNRDVEVIKQYQLLLEIKPMYKEILGYIQINRIVMLIELGKLNNASINLQNAVKKAKDNNQVGILALLNYLDSLLYKLINNDESKLKKASFMLEAHGIKLENFKSFYNI